MSAKTRYSGFYGTSLDQLSGLQPQCVDVEGVRTFTCAMETVGGLVNRDDSERVLRDEVADFELQAHAHVLERLGKIYGAKII
ncbi:MAG: isochorismatase family protein [Desulfobacteraceae bacterium]|jgi:nicotinamidase-related amidase